MPKFHETGYGRRFLEGQLPELLETLKKIAGELEKIADTLDSGTVKVRDLNTPEPGSLTDFARR